MLHEKSQFIIYTNHNTFDKFVNDKKHKDIFAHLGNKL